MLILSRKTGQQIKIGSEIQLTIVGLEGSRVCLGIDAPREYPILRGELLERADQPLYIEVDVGPDAVNPTCMPAARIELR